MGMDVHPSLGVNMIWMKETDERKKKGDKI